MGTDALAFEPACLTLLASGELGRRVEAVYEHLEDCVVVARCFRRGGSGARMPHWGGASATAPVVG